MIAPYCSSAAPLLKPRLLEGFPTAFASFNPSGAFFGLSLFLQFRFTPPNARGEMVLRPLLFLLVFWKWKCACFSHRKNGEISLRKSSAQRTLLPAGTGCLRDGPFGIRGSAAFFRLKPLQDPAASEMPPGSPGTLSRTTSLSKILRFNVSSVTIRILSSLKYQFPKEKWTGLPYYTNLTKFSYRYYVYTLGRILI